MTGFAALPDLLLEPLVRAALIEDLGPNGDVTSRAVIPASTRYRAKLNAREAGVVSATTEPWPVSQRARPVATKSGSGSDVGASAS